MKAGVLYADIINNENYNWNFKSLSHLANVLRLPRLFMIDKDWDWEYVSECATWISTEKNKDYFFWKFKSNLSFPKLSLRRDIGLTQQVIAKTEQMDWDWNALVNNESVIFEFAYIMKHQDKPWNWALLSNRDDLDFAIVDELREKPWDWYVLTGKDCFEPTIDTLDYIVEKEAGINWATLNMNICQEKYFSQKLFLDFEFSSGELELTEMIKRLLRMSQVSKTVLIHKLVWKKL